MKHYLDHFEIIRVDETDSTNNAIRNLFQRQFACEHHLTETGLSQKLHFLRDSNASRAQKGRLSPSKHALPCIIS